MAKEAASVFRRIAGRSHREIRRGIRPAAPPPLPTRGREILQGFHSSPEWAIAGEAAASMIPSPLWGGVGVLPAKPALPISLATALGCIRRTVGRLTAALALATLAGAGAAGAVSLDAILADDAPKELSQFGFFAHLPAQRPARGPVPHPHHPPELRGA